MKRSVDAIAKLDPKDPKTGEKLMLENGKLLGNLQTYTKGKKSKRFYSSSQARFDNSLDVLSVVDDHVPGMRQYADQIVKRTNEVRNVGPMDDDYVDLSEYGVKRAEWVAPEGTRAYDRKISAKWPAARSPSSEEERSMPKKTIPEMTDKELEREALEGLNTQQT